jgi:hypothetical protein
MSLNVVTEMMDIAFAGQRVTVKMTGDADKNREVVEIVQARLRAAEEKGGGKIPSHIVAVHGLFELAEEYAEAKRRFLSFQAEMKENLALPKGLEKTPAIPFSEGSQKSQ